MDNNNWKTKALLVGALIGALTGAGAAYLLIRKTEDEEGQPTLTTGDGLKLGLLVLGLLRQIAQLGEGD